MAQTKITTREISDTAGIVNAQISAVADIAISKTALGTYTAWTTWVPTYTVNGAGTWSSVTTRTAQYTQIGKVVFFIWSGLGTTSGISSARQITLSLPIASTLTALDSFGGGFLINFGSATRTAGVWFNSNATSIHLQNLDNAVFTNAANTGGQVVGHYPVA
jgi:hypothetical protein